MPVVDTGSEVIEFPDSMSDDDIKSALDRLSKSKALVAGSKATSDALGRTLGLLQAGAAATPSPEQLRLENMSAAGLTGEVLKRFVAPAVRYPLEQIQQAGGDLLSDVLQRTGLDPSAMPGRPIADIDPTAIPGTDIHPLDLISTEIRKGVSAGAKNLIDPFLTPEGISTAPFLGLKPVQALYGASAAVGLPEQVQNVAQSKNLQEAAQALTELGGNVAMTGLMGRELLKGEPYAPKEGFGKESRVSQYPGTETQRLPAETGGGNRPVGEEAVQTEVPNVTQTTPKAEPSPEPTAANARPAIRLVGGDVVTGEAGKTHADIINENNLKAADIDQRGFVDDQGSFSDREQTAAKTGLPTQNEPGRQHSTDLPEAQPAVQPATQAGAAHVSELAPSETAVGAEKYGVAERVRQERAAAGQVEEISRGEGTTPLTEIQRGRAELQANPGLAKSLMAKFEADGSMSDQTFRVGRAQGEVFADVARRIEEQFGTDSPQYRQARDELTDWDRRYKALQTKWHASGQAQQGETDIDTGSYTGLERAYNERTGNNFTPEQGKGARKRAKRVKEASDAVNQANTDLSGTIEREFPKQARSSDPEKAALDAASKTVRENAIRIAKADERARLAKTEQERQVATIEQDRARKLMEESQRVAREAVIRLAKKEREVETQRKLDDQEKAERSALDAASKTVREAAVKMADAENKARTAKTKRESDTAKEQSKATKQALDAAQKVRNEAAARLAKIENENRVNPERRVWESIKRQMDQGETDLHKMRGKAAVELGLSNDKVTELMARTPRVKRVADDVVLKQQTLRRMQNAAKRWLADQQAPLWEKVLFGGGQVGPFRWPGVSGLFFKIRVGFHGTVAPGTHAPMLFFSPKDWGDLLRDSGKMYKMVGLPVPSGQRAARVFFEEQMANLVRDRKPDTEKGIPGNYWGVARRNGLINDPYQYEDFTSPDTARFIGDLTGMGNRGYSMLKLLRQDLFNRAWESLPRFMRTDEMAKQLSDQINHITGVTQKPPFQGSHFVLFAPRLLLSRLAWLGRDPGKALGIILNWKNESLENKEFARREITGKLTVFATMMGMLGAAQALLTASGSKQKINGIPQALGGAGINPNESDFLHFKGMGMDFAFGSPMINMARLPARLVAIGMGPKGKFGKIIYPDDEVWTEAGRFIGGQMAPAAQIAFQTLITREDPTGKQLPHSARPQPKRLLERGITPYTWGEYVTQQLSPIPFQEMEKDIWGKNFGSDEKQMKAWATLLFMLGTGGRMREDLPKKQTKATLP